MIRRRLLSSFTSSTYCLPQTISQLLAHHIDVQGSQQPATITVTGWIKSIRRQKNVSFAVLTDGSPPKGLQAVFTYPIQKQALSNEYLRDYAHLRARTDRIASMVRLRSALKRNISEWFETEGFHQVHTPILTGNDAEGAGEAFRIAPMLGEHPAAIAAAAASSSATFTPTLTSPPTSTPTDFFSLPAYLTVSINFILRL
ncbi:hypothetical protein JOM56_006966 [Amanita muscaria]